ncbi:MAG: alpha/beta hydrolase, partial [Pseudomonadota bacterium]
MKTPPDLALLLLHALPLDGRMWERQLGILRDQTYSPDLYGFGESIKDWATSCLELIPQKRIVVVGCSVGGSCALEVMSLAPDRVAAAVLVGTKARHDPNPAALAESCRMVENHGVAAAWERYWKPLFDQGAYKEAAQTAEEIALAQSANSLVNGLKSFHTRESREEILKQSAIPIRIVTGDQDELPGLDYSRRLAELSSRK